jgi:hypothetical protein
MSDVAVGLLISLCVFLGALAGMQLHHLIAPRHRTAETREVVRLGIGMISVLAALVLGLLTASAKRTFDDAERNIGSYATDIVQLDRTLRHFGEAADPIRASLLRYTDEAVRRTWSDSKPTLPLEDSDAGALLDRITHQILALKTQDDDQRWVRAQALEISARLLHTRGTILMNQRGTISPILLGVVAMWIAVIFAGYSLNAPRNGAVVVAFLICSLSIGAAIFLILDMDSPFNGTIMVSGEPLKSALAHLQSR